MSCIYQLGKRVQRGSCSAACLAKTNRFSGKGKGDPYLKSYIDLGAQGVCVHRVDHMDQEATRN